MKSNSAARAFTLLELLVVIAIIAGLAALLLPALSRAKAPVRSAACKNRLRLIGTALRMYVDETGKYPPAMFWDDPTQDWPPTGGWTEKLRSYLDVVSEGGSVSDPFFCQRARNHDTSVHYYYNASGTGQPLGLGWSDASDGRITSDGINESRVAVPSNMLAIGEGYVGAGAAVGLGWPGRWWEFEFRPHGRDGNAVFCDGHVESSKPDVGEKQQRQSAAPGDVAHELRLC